MSERQRQRVREDEDPEERNSLLQSALHWRERERERERCPSIQQKKEEKRGKNLSLSLAYQPCGPCDHLYVYALNNRNCLSMCVEILPCSVYLRTFAVYFSSPSSKSFLLPPHPQSNRFTNIQNSTTQPRHVQRELCGVCFY